MNTYIALLRGINVGGKNHLPMKGLVAILEYLGCSNVRTYIQSGNAVFRSSEKDAALLGKRISDAIRRRHGFAPVVMVLHREEFERAIGDNPFPEVSANHNALHVRFLERVPELPDLNALERVRSDGERFRFHRKLFYLHAPNGVGKSRLAANAERLIGVPMTDRNWKTVCTLRVMAREAEQSE